ncbi:MAG: hypothetical protein PSV22_03460 [Pseudolabrys sp.]|nr:hypothetical protein [Pseudolabrys sp.]
MTDGMITAIISAGSGLFGTVIGGLISYFTVSAQKNKERESELRSISKGVGAELKAYVDLVTLRDHTAAIKIIIGQLELGHDVKLSGLASSSGTIRDFFPVFFANIGKIGGLEDDIEDLAKFHTQLAGVYATLTKVANGAFDGSPIGTKINLLETEIALWENTLTLGRSAAADLLSKKR